MESAIHAVGHNNGGCWQKTVHIWGKLRKWGQLKFMVHVQKPARNSREDEISKSKRIPWESLYERYVRAHSTHQLFAVSYADYTQI